MPTKVHFLDGTKGLAMQIARDTIVVMHYTLHGDDEELIDSSEGSEPLGYLHGHGSIVTGLEKALEGATIGAKLKVTVQPEEGYGAHDPSLNLKVPWNSFPPEASTELTPGVQFAAPNPHTGNEDDVVVFTVVDRDDETVSITGNHPLAGKTLHFAVEIISIRAATEQELAHGHSHGPEGADH